MKLHWMQLQGAFGVHPRGGCRVEVRALFKTLEFFHSNFGVFMRSPFVMYFVSPWPYSVLLKAPHSLTKISFLLTPSFMLIGWEIKSAWHYSVLILKRQPFPHTLHVKQPRVVEESTPSVKAEEASDVSNVTRGEFMSEEVITNHLVYYRNVTDIFRWPLLCCSFWMGPKIE